MKTKLLSSVFFMMLFSGVNAQTKTWDFGNDATTWPLSSGIATETIKDNLGLYPIATNTNFGAVTASNGSFPDGYTGVNRFQMNGGGGVTAPTYLPVQRYLYFDVNSGCQVKVWFKTGSNGSTRTIFVTDGTSLIGSGTSNTGGNADVVTFTANYTNTAGGRLYIYGDAANNLYKVEVTGTTVNTSMASTDKLKNDQVSVFSNGKLVQVANVKSSTQLDVYNVTGALVKSLVTNEDTNIDFLTSGLYIVNVKSAEGQKSVKIVVQ